MVLTIYTKSKLLLDLCLYQEKLIFILLLKVHTIVHSIDILDPYGRKISCDWFSFGNKKKLGECHCLKATYFIFTFEYFHRQNANQNYFSHKRTTSSLDCIAVVHPPPPPPPPPGNVLAMKGGIPNFGVVLYASLKF